MKKNYGIQRLFLYLFCGMVFGALLASPQVFAANGDKLFESTTNSNIGHFEIDELRNRVYAADETLGQLRIINLGTMKELPALNLGTAVYDLAITEDGASLWVTVYDELPKIVIIDLESLSISKAISLPEPGYEIDLGNSYAYVSASSSYNGIMRISLENHHYIDSFDGGLFTYYKAMIVVSPDKSRLYVSNRGVSPISLGTFDISGVDPKLVTSRRDIGGNGQSLAVEPLNGSLLSVAAGSGNSSGYDTHILHTDNLALSSMVDTSAFPRAVTYHPNGLSLFSHHSSGTVNEWDVVTGALIASYKIDGAAKAIALDADGKYLLVSDKSRSFSIYQITDDIVPATIDLSGTLSGAELTKLSCYNKTTSEYLSVYLDSKNTWDCLSYGFTVKPGDVVRVSLTAGIND